MGRRNQRLAGRSDGEAPRCMKLKAKMLIGDPHARDEEIEPRAAADSLASDEHPTRKAKDSEIEFNNEELKGAPTAVGMAYLRPEDSREKL